MRRRDAISRTQRARAAHGVRTRPSPADAPHPHPVIPVLRPRLATAERLMPYLTRIDQTRIYSNWGPLVQELTGRLGDLFAQPQDRITTASPGTSAIAGAILGTAGRATGARPLAAIPAFTFVATANAVEQCGYRPYLVDVDPDTWMLDPDALAGHPQLDRVGVVVPVAAFGRPVAQARWRAFSERTGIPVVIDGAACSDRIAAAPDGYFGSIPVAMSFHATKGLSTGEGGCVVASDPQQMSDIQQALNFGFVVSRNSGCSGLNGKMSEYHAAVGLAEIDGWPDKRRALEDVARGYRRALFELDLADRLFATPDVSVSYALFDCRAADAAVAIRRSLASRGIDSRRWYGEGLGEHEYLADAARAGDLAVTQALGCRLLGLPVAPDLTAGEIGRVATTLAAGVWSQR